VKLVTERIDEITETGIKTSNSEVYEVDTIIYATGFDLVKSMNAFQLIGEGARNYAEEIVDAPAAYKGVVVVSRICKRTIFDPIMHVTFKGMLGTNGGTNPGNQGLDESESFAILDEICANLT
jgi:hypothetical protein